MAAVDRLARLGGAVEILGLFPLSPAESDLVLPDLQDLLPLQAAVIVHANAQSLESVGALGGGSASKCDSTQALYALCCSSK